MCTGESVTRCTPSSTCRHFKLKTTTNIQLNIFLRSNTSWNSRDNFWRLLLLTSIRNIWIHVAPGGNEWKNIPLLPRRKNERLASFNWEVDDAKVALFFLSLMMIEPNECCNTKPPPNRPEENTHSILQKIGSNWLKNICCVTKKLSRQS